jgi:hypothetical protein
MLRLKLLTVVLYKTAMLWFTGLSYVLNLDTGTGVLIGNNN